MGVLCAAAAAFLWVRLVRSKPEERVYRIGWADNPPFQQRGQDGRATGFAVELVREAARRRGIRLEWVEEHRNSEMALRSKKVDLWPLILITPERKKVIHITEPYFETAPCYVVRAHSKYKQPADLATARISYADLPINYRIVHGSLPNAQLLARPTTKEVLDDVCLQSVDAAFLDEPAAIAAMLAGAECASQPLRLISTPGRAPIGGIGATFESRAAADALREEIGVIATEGKLAGILSRGGYFSGRTLQSMEALLQAKRRERGLTAGIAAVSFLLLLTLWQAVRIRRERNKAKRAEQALRETEERFRTIVETAPDGIFIGDLSARLLEVNEAACKQVGYTREELLQRTVRDIEPGRFVERVTAGLQAMTDAVRTYESCHRRADGAELPVELKVRRMMFGGQPAFVAISRDISERKHAEQERAKLEAQLRQAQRLETVGRLAGGIAHDFNNLLTVINGYSDLLLNQVPPGDPRRAGLEEIRKSGERAAGLTRQLLAFSRKQATCPKPINLNDVIIESQGMLRRLVGDDVEIVTVLSPSLGRLMADSGQIDQVLMNLVANARDAMPDGGKLTIETANVELPEATSGEESGLPAGPYVSLIVADTGVGMDEETRQHIFEPFFTTKGVGQGTGLGLSTVYGIVRQVGGCIDVCSEPGKGTSFRICWPRIEAAAVASETTPPGSARTLLGTETVLVVEDQPAVRRLTGMILEEHGYHVLEAATAADALVLASQHAGLIHLLLTDIMMPGMNGRQLAERLKPLRPEMKVLYTSGGGRDPITNRGVLDPGEAYIPKPFLPETLAAKVREVLVG